MISAFLRESGWESCQKCGEVTGSTGPLQRSKSVGEWWKSLMEESSSDDDKEAIRAAAERSVVRSGDVGPFVTTLVERLSEIDADTLGERFGEEARNRLRQLHDLARFAIDDEQVRADTRRSFAANRLVRTWLPGGRQAERRAIGEIRTSIAGYSATHHGSTHFGELLFVLRCVGHRKAMVAGTILRRRSGWESS